MLRVLIVDDELLGRQILRELLECIPDVEIIGEAGDGASAVHTILELRPDLVFLDVQMPELDGIDVLRRVTPDYLPLVVFVTAYDRFAVQAFDYHALDYILKPVSVKRLTEAVERARVQMRGREAAEAHEKVSALLDRYDEPGNTTQARDDRARPLRRIVVRKGEDYMLVSTGDIDTLEAAGNYVRIQARNGSFLIRSTLTELEHSLDAEHFARVHRSTIVNIDRIDRISPQMHGDYQITLKDGRRLRMSRHFRERLLP